MANLYIRNEGSRKQRIRCQGLPCEVRADPLCPGAHQMRLRKALAGLDAGKGQVREWIETEGG